MMRRGLTGIAVLLVFLLPQQSKAEILINEISWMGTDEGGANCEWIEFYNTAPDTVDLSGYSLTIENAGSATPKVLLFNDPAAVKYSGIAGGGFYLLARNSGSCGDLAPGTTADWLGSFGNGISNTGSKLILKNGTSEEDVVDALVGWTQSGIGGKNTSGQPKQTPQRTGGGWLVGTPTPRSANISPEEPELPEEEEETGTSTPVVTIGGATPLTPIEHPVLKLYIEAGDDRIVTAGADTPYEAIVFDQYGKIRRDANVSWNFGDGTRESGESTLHAYKEPGEYTAVIRARARGVSVVTIVTVIAQPVALSIESVSEEGITVRNHSNQLADLSLWKIADGSKKGFKLPEDTVIAPKRSVFFAVPIASTTQVSLAFPNGKSATVYEPVVIEVGKPQPVAVSYRPQGIELVPELPVVEPTTEASSETVLQGATTFLGSMLASMASFVVP